MGLDNIPPREGDECLQPDCPSCTEATKKYWESRAFGMLALLRKSEWGFNGETGCPWCSRLKSDGEHTFDCPLALLCKFMKRSGMEI